MRKFHCPVPGKKMILNAALLLLISSQAFAQSSGTVPPTTDLLVEYFDGTSDNSWPTVNHGDSAIAKVKDGNYVLDIKNASRFWALRLGIIGEFNPAPDVLEMKMKLTSNAATAAYGIIWSTVRISERIFDEYSFLLTRDGTFGLMKRENGNTYTVKDWTQCTCINKTDYNTLRIEQSADGEHRFYINNQLVFQSKMSPTNLASIGFYCDAHTVLSTDYIHLAKRTL